MLGVSKRTVENRMAEYHMTNRNRYSDIDDNSLDAHTERIIATCLALVRHISYIIFFSSRLYNFFLVGSVYFYLWELGHIPGVSKKFLI